MPLPSRNQRTERLSLISLFLLFVMISFQNCGDVSLVSPSNFTPTPEGTGEGVSYLKIPPSTISQYRAAFLIDMSNSMYKGACADSIDVLIPNVEAVDGCDGPSGVDQEGKRFRILLQWIAELKSLVTSGKITNEQVKLMAIPFAGNEGIRPRIDLRQSGSTIRAVMNRLSVSSDQFLNLDHFSLFVESLWAIELLYHNKPIPPLIRGEVINAVRASYNWSASTGASSSGTSIPYPMLELMTTRLNAELQSLGSEKANFELMFLSDGVPKPHAEHIKAAVNKIWNEKTKVCDDRGVGYSNRCSWTGEGEGYILGWQTVTGGRICQQRCGIYLQTYVETGAVNLPMSESPTCTDFNPGNEPPYLGAGCDGYSDGSSPETYWGQNIKCDACFRMLRQFDFPTPGTSAHNPLRPEVDSFKNKTTIVWGDWLLNRHSRIMSQLKTMERMFSRQYPGNRWKFNFLRIDSATERLKTQDGELTIDINWLERAKEQFSQMHRSTVITSTEAPFALFPNLGSKNEYKVSMIYAYPRNYRAHIINGWQLDGDADGMIDSNEVEADRNRKRSNGICLDGIRATYSQCISVGCNPAIDGDNDGLNQCEEDTLGTSDFEVDSDRDGIIDEAEVLFGLNPVDDDSRIYLSPDRLSNFEHFVRGYSPRQDLRNVPIERQIQIQTEIIDYQMLPNALGVNVLTPGYKIKISNFPVHQIESAASAELVVVIAIQNITDPNDKLWLAKTYPISESSQNININFNDFQELNLRAP